MKRRQFVEKSSLLAATSILLPEFSYLKANNRNDRLQIGVIGCNGMGWSNVHSILKNSDVDLIAICDVDAGVVQRRLNDYQKLRENVPATYTDYRELIADQNVDAVIIGTPDHWHCKIMVDAVQSGKHVYTEKPVANTIEECNIMMEAAAKYDRVVQVGQWQRSGPHYRKAIDIVRSGVLGNIRLVKTWAYQGWMSQLKDVKDEPVPEGVDYTMWLGPAPHRPFNANRFHFNFRWYWDYAGGLMTDWGVHEIDIALFAMQAKAPKSVFASGGKLAYPDDPSETPDTLQAIYTYDNFSMLWEHAVGIDNGPYGRREGIAFIGNNGTLVVDRKGYEVLIEREPKGYSSWGDARMESVEQGKAEGYALDLHTANFVSAIKANDASILNTPIESGSVAAINAQMGNISYKTGMQVNWDATKNMFTNNERANELAKANYHQGWKVPIV